jgi:hypothetical protein
MADIDVERKRTSPWPWLLALLAIAALVALALLWWGRDDAEPADRRVVDDTVVAPGMAVPPVTGGPAGVAPVVDEFQRNCMDAPAEMARDHQFVADCLRRLATGVDAVLERPHARGVDARGELAEVRRRADELEASPPDAGNHSALVSGAFTSATALMERLQRERFPELAGDAAALRPAATAVRPGEPLLEQRQEVQEFFRRSGEVMHRMMMEPAGN